jgi:glycosyltransferase involved in cell wall biosynthesis
MRIKTILIICPFPYGVAAGQRLKYEQYIGIWRDNGYSVTISSFMDDSMWKVVYCKGKYFQKVFGTLKGYVRRFNDIFHVCRYDIVYVHQWITPFGTTLIERVICKLSNKIIYDLEDNIVMGGSSNVNYFTNFIKNPNKTKYLIRVADYVISSSPYLNNYCLALNNKKMCSYVSSSVNTDVFLPANACNKRKITIGWTGTFSSVQYLNSLRSVLIELKKYCNFKLRIIGNFEYTFPEVDLEVIQWDKENEVKDMQEIDIGIYPLFCDEWVLGKSGLKAIQYMAFGIPCVATNIGTSSDIINHMDDGWLVSTDEEWVAALKELINDSNLRRKIGTNARKKIVDSYSIHAIKNQYLSILDSM